MHERVSNAARQRQRHGDAQHSSWYSSSEIQRILRFFHVMFEGGVCILHSGLCICGCFAWRVISKTTDKVVRWKDRQRGRRWKDDILYWIDDILYWASKAESMSGPYLDKNKQGDKCFGFSPSLVYCNLFICSPDCLIYILSLSLSLSLSFTHTCIFFSLSLLSISLFCLSTQQGSWN